MFSVLNPLVYFLRNANKTLPVAFVIVIAVALVASVVTIIHSIDLTVYTIYGYNRYLTGLTPRNALTVDDDDVNRIQKLPELGVLCRTHSYQILLKTTFGKMLFPIFGMDAPGRKLILERTRIRLVSGRMPKEGMPEAVLSDAVAKNLGAKIGDVILNPDSQDAFAPVAIRLVGLLHGPVWLGLTSRDLADDYSPFTYVGYLAFSPAASQPEQRRLDAAMDRVVDKAHARVWKYGGLVEETKSALSYLYLILDIVVGIIVFAIAFVCGLLANIYFTQRLPEVATLFAIGYSRNYLLLRAMGDIFLLCMVGWLLGGGVSVVLLYAIRDWMLAPHGLLLNPIDPGAYAFTLPLPITIILFAMLTIWLRLKSLDPVSIIERRG